ncbi:MAG: hypothetical protein F4137_05555 [Acidobacteria bacterium]|nr:hypothetical protein [Acidobacteriota bacterium]MYH28317.1 hypothetical protein [Acidobacteriota bacterium]
MSRNLEDVPERPRNEEDRALFLDLMIDPSNLVRMARARDAVQAALWRCERHRPRLEDVTAID